MRAADTAKIATLRSPFRSLIVQMLGQLDAEGILYLIGDGYRSPEAQLVTWSKGRTLHEGGDANNPADWTKTGATVTNAHPATGKNPHLYRMAVDIYPKDPDTGGIMTNNRAEYWQWIYRMWAVAESLGIDALGHKTADPGDQVWRDDPCHFQLLGWFNHKHDLLET